jgi:histidine kinase
LKFIRRADVPLLVKILLVTAIPFAVAVLFLFDARFLFANAVKVLSAAAILFCLVYIALNRLVLLPIRSMIEGIEKIRLGEKVPFETVHQKDELGQLARAIREVGEEVRAKHLELSEQREIYWQLFDAAPCMITVQNRDYELIRYNKYFGEHFRVKEGMHCYEAYKNQSWKCEDCPTEKTFEKGRPHFSEESGFYKDGTRAQWIVNSSPIFDGEGRVAAAMSVSLDITARKKLAEELRRSERKYFAVFENIPSALFLIDQQTLAVTDCNRSATLLYGYTKGQLIGKSFPDLFAETDRAGCGQAVRALQPIQRAKHTAKDGRVLFVNISLSDAEYQVRGKAVLATVIDITERIESEQQAVHANKMATLGEMATGVSHELNQPLLVIQMISNAFLRKLDRGEPTERETLLELSSKLRANVERASKIIQHMREFGRKSDSEAGSVRINDVILRSLEFFNQQLLLRDIRVVLELGEDLPAVKADPNRLEQVFVNLLTNSRDAIGERILREPSFQGEKRITLRTRANRRYVIAEVCDTGVGVPKEIRHRLFEPFFTTKDVGKGTGLGLSISYKIVTDYGGTIKCTSRQEEGACFEIVFPRESST